MKSLPVQMQIASESYQNLQERTVEQLLSATHAGLFVLVLVQEHFRKIPQKFGQRAAAPFHG